MKNVYDFLTLLKDVKQVRDALANGIGSVRPLVNVMLDREEVRGGTGNDD